MKPDRRNPHRADATPEPHGLPYRAGVAPLSSYTVGDVLKDIRKAKKRDNAEHRLQKQVAEYLDRALPADAWWTSIDSAGRGPVQGARMKARGVKRGTLDTLIIWRGITVWIELKSRKGRVTAEQAVFCRMVEDAGHFATVCRSLEAVDEALRFYGIPLRCRVSA